MEIARYDKFHTLGVSCHLLCVLCVPHVCVCVCTVSTAVFVEPKKQHKVMPSSTEPRRGQPVHARTPLLSNSGSVTSIPITESDDDGMQGNVTAENMQCMCTQVL